MSARLAHTHARTRARTHARDTLHSWGPAAVKQAEPNCGRRQNTSYLALQARETNDRRFQNEKEGKRKKKKKKSSVYNCFINASMRASRRWGKWSGRRPKPTSGSSNHRKMPFNLEGFRHTLLDIKLLPVWSVSSTRSTAHTNIKKILIAMVFVLHVFLLSKWWQFCKYTFKILFFC